MDHQKVGAAISTISSNLPEMAKGVKLISALTEKDDDRDDRLLDAARKLLKAFSDLLNAAGPGKAEVAPPSSCLSFRVSRAAPLADRNVMAAVTGRYYPDRHHT